MAKNKTQEELRRILKSAIDFETNQTQLAERLGISCGYLNEVLRGKKGIGADLAAAMGYKLVTSYVKK